MANNQDFVTVLSEKFGDKILGYKENYGLMSIFVDKEFNLKVLQFLYDHPDLQFQFMNDLTAVHYPDRVGEELLVTYLISNLSKKYQIRLNFALDVNKPNIYTATSVFATANWLERECYDFFGVNFIGHPNLIRVMNVLEMDYFPLRKEIPLEDQTRKDKDDEMFGRGGSFNYQNMTIN